MKRIFIGMCFCAIPFIFLFSKCTGSGGEKQIAETTPPVSEFGGYQSMEEWGNHIVTVSGCHDCHTPKKMGPAGPELDSSLLLSGHPANMPGPDIDRSEVEKKGLIVTSTLTAWTGPWGTSFAANLTSDLTGIGGWAESNFLIAIREGKLKGIRSGRSLLPPMPWQMFRNMTDDELKAIFAFLKSTAPVKNVVPMPVAPSHSTE